MSEDIFERAGEALEERIKGGNTSQTSISESSRLRALYTLAKQNDCVLKCFRIVDIIDMLYEAYPEHPIISGLTIAKPLFMANVSDNIKQEMWSNLVSLLARDNRIEDWVKELLKMIRVP